MQHHRRTAGPAAVVAVFALTMTVMGALGTASSAAAEHGPLYQAPRAGTCYNLPGKIVSKQLTTAKRPRSCKKAHTLWVAGSRKVPGTISMKDISGKNKELWAFIDKACTAKWAKRLGTLNRRFGLTAYARFPFLPTRKQRANGAHWVSCELGVFNGKTALVKDRVRKAPKLSNHPRRLVKRCGTRKYYAVSCTRAHRFEVKYASLMIAKDGAAKMRARKFCKQKVKSSGTWMYSWIWVGDAKGPKSRWVASCLPKTGHNRVIAGAGHPVLRPGVPDAVTARH